MKILAISRYIKDVNWENMTETLKHEAHEAYKLYLSEKVREIYFTENDDAVLIMECKSIIEARQLVSKLPLVREKIIAFKFHELKPYTGFSRIIVNPNLA